VSQDAGQQVTFNCVFATTNITHYTHQHTHNVQACTHTPGRSGRSGMSCVLRALPDTKSHGSRLWDPTRHPASDLILGVLQRSRKDSKLSTTWLQITESCEIQGSKCTLRCKINVKLSSDWASGLGWLEDCLMWNGPCVSGIGWVDRIEQHPRIRNRIGQNPIYKLYTTVYLVFSLLKIPCMHRIYLVLANPR